MHRVDTLTAAAELPAIKAAEAPGYFTEGDFQEGIPATVPGQDWFNAVQEEILAVVEAAGIEPVKGEHGQLLEAVAHNTFQYAETTGAANAYVLTLSPALAAHIPGMPVRFKASFSNTGAATIAINGLAAVPLKKNYNQAVVAGDIQSGQIITLHYDGTNYQVFGLSETISSLLTAQGDLLYASAANVLARLAIGSVNNRLYVNATGTAPEWSKGMKLASFTRDITAASGDVSYIGAGFKPSAVIILAANGSGVTQWSISIGIADDALQGGIRLGYDALAEGFTTYILKNLSGSGASVGQKASVTSRDADGVTLSWEKVGSPAAGTISGLILYIR